MGGGRGEKEKKVGRVFFVSRNGSMGAVEWGRDRGNRGRAEGREGESRMIIEVDGRVPPLSLLS